MSKKLTIVEQYDKVKALLNGEVVEDYTIEQALQFLTERSAQTAKKNASGGGERKPTKTQLENEGIKEQIVTALGVATAPISVQDLQKLSANLSSFSNQKITSLLTQLVKSNQVIRTEVKGKPYFALATEE